jgi:hypothetical protein
MVRRIVSLSSEDQASPRGSHPFDLLIRLSVAALTDLWAQNSSSIPPNGPAEAQRLWPLNTFAEYSRAVARLTPPNDGRNRTSVVLESSASCDALDPAYCRYECSILSD